MELKRPDAVHSFMLNHSCRDCRRGPLFDEDPVLVAKKNTPQRDRVKKAMLSYVYGGGADALFNKWYYTKPERRLYMERLDNRFHVFKHEMDTMVADAMDIGYMALPNGFKLRVDRYRQNPRQTRNFAIQGRAAMVMQYWLEAVDTAIKQVDPESWICGELFDGLYLSVPQQSFPATVQAVKPTLSV